WPVALHDECDGQVRPMCRLNSNDIFLRQLFLSLVSPVLDPDSLEKQCFSMLVRRGVAAWPRLKP
ncbi:hypothetical protein Tco_0900217, partial [Tanacetum coccineum]